MPNPHLPATILTPATTAPGLPDAVHHEHLGLDNTGEQAPPDIATPNDTEMQAGPLSDATTDNDHLGMLIDDEPFLQINLHQDEVEQLYNEAMDEPHELLESLRTEDNPRDGLLLEMAELENDHLERVALGKG